MRPVLIVIAPPCRDANARLCQAGEPVLLDLHQNERAAHEAKLLELARASARLDDYAERKRQAFDLQVAVELLKKELQRKEKACNEATGRAAALEDQLALHLQAKQAGRAQPGKRA